MPTSIIKIVSAIAEADDAVAKDQLNNVAPAILKTSFVSPVSDTPPFLPELTDTEFHALKDPQSDTDRVEITKRSEGKDGNAGSFAITDCRLVNPQRSAAIGPSRQIRTVWDMSAGD